MIDRATVDKIMEATNIVDVVGEFVNLRKAGVNYKGLCPFHDDKTPSFMVSPARQICKCFSCGEGGNAVNFLMKHEQITYPEALRWLAKKYNIEIQERELTDDEKREQSDRESMFVVNEWACQYFHEILKNDVDGIAIGKQYFRSRGIRDDIIEKFHLGFALSKRDALANEARRKGFKDEFLIKTGLCYQPSPNPQHPSPDNRLLDRFAGRAMFPWLNVSGKVVAFGGRKLDAATKGVQQKYVNSPDSEIYHKERELYGIYQAKKAIVKEDCVYMVEGYTDVIAMHQCGLENVVANSGTALSNHQIRLLHRFTQNIVLLYDGDEAGIHAAMRGTDMLLAEGMNIKVLLLPDGDDPDSFSRKHTAEEFKTYIVQHQTDFIQFKTDLLLKGVTDPQKRSEAVSSILKSVSVIPDKLKRDTYLSECSHRFNVNEQALVTTVNTYIQREKEEKEKQQGARDEEQGAKSEDLIVPIGLHTAQEQTTEVERLLIQNIIRHGDEIIYEGVETDDGQLINLNVAQFIDYDLGADGLEFSNPLFNRILQEAVEHSGDAGFKADLYFMQHPDPQVSQLAASLGIDRHQLSRSFQVTATGSTLRQRIEHLILDFRMDIVSQHLKELQLKMKEIGSDMTKLKAVMDDYKQTQELRNELARQRGSDVIV